MKTKLAQYKKRNMELSKEAMRATSYIPTFQAKIQGLERTARIQESDLKYQTGEADKYKNQVYGLQVELESVEARLGEELQAVKEKLALTEGERDALKTSLQEEEVMRIAAEGQIALPATTIEEQDEFASPVRAARKQRTTERDDEDKENMSPKKPTVELKFLQQELASEKRLRERAQEQIEFMKMECQFECCSCRIADLKGAKFVHDGSYSVEMEHIKSSVPVTPPPSNHEDDPMDGVTIKQEPLEDDRPFTFPPEEQEPEMKPETIEEALEMTGLSQPPASPSPEPNIAFSPTTGTFRAMPSPAKASVSTDAVTPANPPSPEPSCIAERILDPPWTPDIKSTVIRTEPVSPPASRAEVRPELEMEPQPHTKANGIYIHEDVVDDNEEEEEEEEEDEDMDAQAPLHDPSAPATPGVFVRTFTTTTTIPLHFSPLTPATKRPDHPMTPSTIAHAPTDAQTPVLGELSMNNLPFDREAALAAIRQRRGRARSMAAGHGTPMKQMMEGVAERRDISAPVSRVRR
ncbi:hypothetical protein K504DRAFT_34675 [Pleomassaria siparia CBS 279.74]|uniref:Uncharacterized protein n=1 Tax=Pleomassaria siparia CBS 279.74 TaxID=1314801 RepID=A0A6G1KTE5_9PLEO|nr:hypothetical protein K504DRAFT_34675 [Pleomassaria siparia CBS 279.74]